MPNYDKYFSRIFFHRIKKCRSLGGDRFRGGLGAPKTHSLLVYGTGTVARWRCRLYMQTVNKGTCSNIAVNEVNEYNKKYQTVSYKRGSGYHTVAQSQ